MPVLKNKRHEEFAQLVGTGETPTAAYRKVYKAKGLTAESCASRLMKHAKVLQRIEEIRAQYAKRVEQKLENRFLSLDEKREFLRQVVTTPVDAVVGTRLHQGYSKGGAPTMPDKLRALELDAKLAGEFRERVEVQVDGLGELLKSIRGGK